MSRTVFEDDDDDFEGISFSFNSIAPWLIAGGAGFGATMFSKNANANSLLKSPEKCPTLKEVKKAAEKIK